MTRGSLTIDRPAAPPAPVLALPAKVPSKRQRFAAAVSAVVTQHSAIAAAHAVLTDLVEEARLAGTALHSTDSFTGGPQWSSDMVVERQIITELAVALHQNEGDTRRLLHTSEGLAGPFAATRGALAAGALSYRHAEKIVQHSNTLPAPRIEAYERELLPVARRVTVQRLERLARAAVEEAQPLTAVQRHLDAAANRRLSIDPASDGMAYLTQYLPAVEAVAIYNRADDLARSAKVSGDPRNLTQLRIDTLVDLMLNGETSIEGITRGIRARVHVTVPVLTLLDGPRPEAAQGDAPQSDTAQSGTARVGAAQTGTARVGAAQSGAAQSDAAHSGAAQRRATQSGAADGGAARPGGAHLEGYGPIDRLTALRITRDAPTFTRVLTDPITGCALSYGRTRYRPPADLDELIRLTYAECTFPLSCNTSANADLDHTVAWSDGGSTEIRNISPLCSHHHKVKHHTEWVIEQSPDGTITWTSPAGFEYVVEPSPLPQHGPRFDEGGGPPPPF